MSTPTFLPRGFAAFANSLLRDVLFSLWPLEGMQRGADASAAGLPASQGRRRVNDFGDNGATCHYYASCSASRPLIWQPGNIWHLAKRAARLDIIWTITCSRPIALSAAALPLCLPTCAIIFCKYISRRSRYRSRPMALPKFGLREGYRLLVVGARRQLIGHFLALPLIFLPFFYGPRAR